MRPRTLISTAAALASAVAVLPATLVLTAAPAAADPARPIATRHWESTADFRTGSARGVVATNGVVRFDRRVGVSGRYDYATWTSPWASTGFAYSEIVPSWTGSTPGDSWVKVELRGRSSRATSSWDTISEWALDDGGRRRTSGGSQTDDLGRVSYDTWIVPKGLWQYQVRLTLHRRTGTASRPVVGAVHAMASRIPSTTGVTPSRPGAAGGAALGKVLDVPRYSQMVHRGTYRQYGGGGQAWCSPTSTTMLLDYYGKLPPASHYGWVGSGPDRVVPHLARMTFDTSFSGTGNWPFNTAYAGSRTGRAFVTRLRDLREAERFIAAGIPLAASLTFGKGGLSGAPISSTNGHLMVIVGFTKAGDVVVNDPAAWSRSGVRRIYDRDQFEDAWLTRTRSGSSARGSGGLVYVVNDAAHPLPARAGNRNW